MFHRVPGGVRHEIQPIRMRYFINSFRERKQHSGEVSVLKISSLTKSVIFFRGRKFVRKLEEQIDLLLVRLLFKLKRLFEFVAISKVMTSRLSPCCFEC